MSQTVSALLRLRELILTGGMRPGDRLSEPMVAERLGVSRTPVRAALSRLEDEGLLEVIPSGGYAVRAFYEDEVRDAIELRGVLEGTAARLAAERGAAPAALTEMRLLLADIDRLLDAALTSAAFEEYVTLNGQFHALLIEIANSAVLTRQLGRVMALPFASPSAFVMAQSVLPGSLTTLTIAQDQHRSVLDAIEAREGARAEALMRDHARLARRNLPLAMRHPAALDLVIGHALIQRRGRG